METENSSFPEKLSKAALKWEAAKSEAAGWELGKAPLRGRKPGAAENKVC